MSSPPAVAPSRGRLWMWLAAVIGVVALPFVVAWPFGGLEDASRVPPRVGLGEPVTGHRLKFVVHRATFTTKDPLATFGAGTPGRYLVLDLDVTNVSRQPATLPQAYLDLRPRLDGQELSTHAYRPVRPDDAGTLLNPGLTERARFSWELPASVREPGRLTVSVLDEVYQPSWSLLGYSSGTSLWYKKGVMATLETAVERA
ncbi:MAG TPA: hypothetical protein VFV66_15510 [Nonomuraea sp.]|nr:hypothetical protein [Nonomuraea sp.]